MNFFRKNPTLQVIIERDLGEAKRSLLDHQHKMEYNQKMAEYYQGIIKRLSATQPAVAIKA